ncbi:Cell division protein FtsZ [Nymphon striatum]|nr:Cell division protein FtsZ [Nymphon striatum]
MPGQEELKPRITVFGVGGAGGNAVNNMIEQELEGVEFVVANTDAQALQQSRSDAKIQMGVKVTEGLGAGARATVGAAAAEESIEQIVDHLAGAHMCFITAGMGGGTGTGAAPIIAQAARELGVLTVGVVTKPFQFEGGKRMSQADAGIEALQKVVDTLIIIPNQNLHSRLPDDVLYQGVKGVTDLMVRPGLINLDFADVRAVMDEMGKAMMGTGEADGGYDLTLFELDEAANKIREKVDPEANIIVGSTLDTGMEGKMRVSVVATGIDAVAKTSDIPVPRRPMAAPLTQQVAAEIPQEAPAPVETPAAVAAEVEVEAAPTLFDEAPVAEPTFDAPAAAAAAESDLPPAAYQPRAEPEIEAPTDVFVAPQRPAVGTPSQETLDRLRTAASRSAAAAAPAAEPMESEEAAKPRMGGLNSLISRMTGQPDGQAKERPQPPVATLREEAPQAAPAI